MRSRSRRAVAPPPLIVVYLYAICDPCRPPLRRRGIAMRGLVPGIVAIVGQVRSIPAVTAAAVRRHDRVVRAVAARADAILPARFGTVWPDERAMRDDLVPFHRVLRAGLRRVRRCVQMTLRVFGASLERPAPRPRAKSGAVYLARRRASLARAAALPPVRAIRAAIGNIVRDELVESHDTPPLVASVYHLVPRGARGSYLRALRTETSGWRHAAVRVTGPWAPYAFVPEPLR